MRVFRKAGWLRAVGTAGILALSVAPKSLGAENLIRNGGFESPVLPPGTNFQQVHPTDWSAPLPGGIVRNDPSWQYHDFYPATGSDGGQYGNFGSTPSNLTYQIFTVPEGQSLSKVAWEQSLHSGNPYFSYQVRVVRVPSETEVASITFNIITPPDQSPMLWVHREVPLPETPIPAGNYRLEFTPLGFGIYPYFVDQVVVEAEPDVPQPPEIESTIDPAAADAYAPNIGWANFHPSAASGVVMGERFLSGHVWLANAGWLDLGNGTPASGNSYSQASGDFGVNINAAGALSGFAYGANIGWVNFDWAAADDVNRPRVDLATGRLFGFAYGANIGWIDLGAAGLATASIARPDLDGDGMSDAWEEQYFQSQTIAGPGTDSDGDGVTDAEEYTAGTDPRDPASRPRILVLRYGVDHAAAILTFSSAPSRIYHIEQTAALPAVWADSGLGAIPGSPDTSTTRTVSVPLDTQTRFFRVVANIPLNR